jgi:hypothetical protein
MMESYVTYENHGDLVLNFEFFPELEGKSDEVIQKWLEEFSSQLFVNVETLELRKDRKYVYSSEEIEQAKADNEELEQFEDDDVVGLWDYWSEAEVQWDKIKNETRKLILS